MTHWERMRAALKCEETDHPPFSLWRHFPVEDEGPEELATATIRWQQLYDFDLVKFMPPGTYSIEDWGGKSVYTPDHFGIRKTGTFGVTNHEDWPRLEQLDVTRGYLGKQLEALRLTAEELKDGVPILQTVLSPLTTARKLAGDRIFNDLRMHSDIFMEGLRIIAETTARFARESLRAGAHGLFFATQCGTYRLLNEDEHRSFGKHFDLTVIDAVRGESDFNLVHAHGEDIMFDLIAGYPVEAINWHDRLTRPSLREARKRFPGLLVGGINEQHTLVNGPIEAIQTEIREAITQTDGRGLMVAPGCVIPIHTPVAHIRAARSAIVALKNGE